MQRLESTVSKELINQLSHCLGAFSHRIFGKVHRRFFKFKKTRLLRNPDSRIEHKIVNHVEKNCIEFEITFVDICSSFIGFYPSRSGRLSTG
jgi:hypothetical protein